MKRHHFPIFLFTATLVFLACSLPARVVAQGSCQGISYSFEHYEPCRFRLHITDNTSECFPQLRLVLDVGEFISWTANTQNGWIVEQVAPTELLVTPSGGFIPLGASTPVEFSLPPNSNPVLSILWDDSCPPGLGCFADFQLMSCSDPGNACISGVTYRECGTLPYTNQFTLSGFEVTLSNEAGQQIGSTTTDANGAYLFCDLPAGYYIIRQTNLPDWTAKVPLSGMYTIDLGESEVTVRNFGNCPSCSCDEILMDMIPDVAVSSDTCTFNAILQNAGQYCFASVDISINSGLITSWTIHEDNWEVLQLDARHLRLLPLDGYVPLEFSNPLSWSATGSSAYEITISSSWNDGNGDEVCERSFGYQCPVEPAGQSCCQSDWVQGPELVVNGDFLGGNNNFITEYTFSNTPPLTPGNYWIGSNPNAINSTFVACPDHTSGNGNMLVANAGPSPTNTFATIWEQTVNVNPNTTYLLEYWIQNVSNSRPVMIFSTINYYFHFNYFSPPNAPCNWVRYCESWYNSSATQANLIIKVVYLTQPGQDFAIDDISFRSCGPPCEADFTATANGSCGSFQFTDTSTHLPANPTYCWDFDGNPSTCESTAANPVWQFPGCGTYPVCLTLSGTGCPEQVVCQQVTVSDLTAPTASCIPGAMVVLDANCQATITPNDVAMAFTDNCQIATTGVSPNTFSACGTVPVTVSVTDWCANVTLLSCQVQVKDNTLPTIVCPPSFSVACNGHLPPTLTGFATATDNCTASAQINMTYTDQLFSQINPLTLRLCDNYIERTWQATDGCGNRSTCVQNISVHDNIAPVLTNCPIGITVLGTLNAEGVCSAALQMVSPTVTDNCDGNPTLTNSFNGTANASGTYPHGSTTVTWTTTDACGNQATCVSVVTVNCVPPDPCRCGTYFDLFLRGPQGAQSQPLTCGGAPINIGCPAPGIGFTLTGNFECDGTDCPPVADVDWELIGPIGGPVATGITQAPWFAVSLASGYFTQAGVYTLILTGHCGSETCPCVIQFLVEEGCPEACPCDLEDLINDVDQGFATSFVGNSCRACFSPLGLSDCDEVEWYVDNPIGTPVGTSHANQTFCYTFPGAGTYTVYLTVTRRRSDGSLCESSVKAQMVTVTRLLRPICDNSAFINPRFGIGAIAGGLNSGGAASGWIGLLGDPLVVEGLPGSQDGWTVELGGNLDDLTILSSLEPICLAQDMGTISIRHKVEHWGDPHENLNGKHLNIAFYQGDNFNPNACTGPNCFPLADIDLSPMDTGWIDLEFPYDLRRWIGPDTCTNPPPGLPFQRLPVRLAIYATSLFSSDQGGNFTRARLQIDNVCLDDLLVGVEELPAAPGIHLFPNPTTGKLTLRFDGATPKKGQLQILDLYGRVVQKQSLAAGLSEQMLSIEALPAGVYFVNVLDAGIPIWIGKVIKQ